MSEFINFTTPTGYLFVHYTKIKIVKSGGLTIAYFGGGITLQLDNEEVCDLKNKLEQLISNKNKLEVKND